MVIRLHCSTVVHKVPSQIYCDLQPSLGCCGRNHGTPWLNVMLTASISVVPKYSTKTLPSVILVACACSCVGFRTCSIVKNVSYPIVASRSATQ